MKRIRLILLAAMATMVMSAIGGIGASSASAAKVPAPLWLVKNALTYDCELWPKNGLYGSLLECLSGLGIPIPKDEWELLNLTNVTGRLKLDEAALILDLSLGLFTFVAGNIEIVCEHTDSEGAIVGGDPGRNHELLTFLKCSLPKNTGCDVWSPDEPENSGIVMFPVKSELILRTQAEKRGNLGVLFEPASGNAFVTLTLKALTGGSCPIFSEGTNTLEGNIVAELEPGGESELVTERMLTFPKTPIAKAFRWEPGTEELKEISVGLKFFSAISVKQLGLADVWLTHGGLFGAHCGGCNV